MDIAQRCDVAVTGVGWVTPLGIGVEPVWGALLAGKRATRIDPFVSEEYTSHPQARRMTRGILFGLIAGQMAVRDAGLDGNFGDRARVIFGTTHPVTSFVEEFHHAMIKTGPATAPPMCFAVGVHNAVPFFLCEEFKIRNGSVTLVGNSAVGLDALIQGCRMLSRPDTRHVLVGASTEVTPTMLTVYENLGMTDSLGEGGVFLVLERVEEARGRGARIYATLTGWDSRCHDSQVDSGQASGVDFGASARVDVRGFMGEGFAMTSLSHVAVAALALCRQEIPLGVGQKTPVTSARVRSVAMHDNSTFVSLKRNERVL